MDIIDNIAWHSTLIFLWVGSGLAILLGIGLLFAPQKTERINRFFARWVDTHSFEETLDRPHWTERYLYRHHRWVGGTLLAGSIVILYRFLLHPPRQKLAMLAAGDTFGLVDAAIAFFVIGAVLGAIIGMLMIGKPSVLRELETASNRWISTDKIWGVFNRMYPSVDRFVFQHRRAVAAVLLLCGIYVFLILGVLLFNGNWKL